MPFNNLKFLLEEFARIHNFPDAVLNDDGICQMLIEESIPMMIRYEEEEDRFQMVACLYPLEESPGSDFYQFVLERNISWEDTACGTLQISSDGQFLELSAFYFLENMEFQEFDGCFERHTECAIQLREEVLAFMKPDDSSEQATGDDAPEVDGVLPGDMV